MEIVPKVAMDTATTASPPKFMNVTGTPCFRAPSFVDWKAALGTAKIQRIPFDTDAAGTPRPKNVAISERIEVLGCTFPSDSLLVCGNPDRFVVTRNKYLSVDFPAGTRGIAMNVRDFGGSAVPFTANVMLSDGKGEHKVVFAKPDTPFFGLFAGGGLRFYRIRLSTTAHVMWLTDWALATE